MYIYRERERVIEKHNYLGYPVYFAEVVEVPLVVGKVLEADLASKVAAVVPGMLRALVGHLLATHTKIHRDTLDSN